MPASRATVKPPVRKASDGKLPGKSRDLTHTLVAGLKEMISSGELQPGDKLPAERELAKRFGVNRSSIRQALKALDIMGIVHQRVGDGTYLTLDASTTLRAPLDFLILVDGISFQELFEARRIVEPELAARAALRRTEDDLAAMENAMAALAAHPEVDAAGLAEHDLHFHEIIWRASGNRVCLRMFSTLHRALSRSLAVTTALRDDGMPHDAHAGICTAIRDRDGEKARTLMHDHLLEGERTLRKSTNSNS